ncbi:MAG: polysaccharide biosynthesis tyrosine autokinase [Muribaculaceae bacterium]|nr:polysaccharide biosynthesis tyrosine autokinase [Muribaculaceae bacterium]
MSKIFSMGNAPAPEEVQPAVAGKGNQMIKFADIAALAVKYWYWILFSLVICGFYAAFSIARTNPLYKETMSVLLRDDVQGNGTGSMSINLSDLGINQPYTVLEDEMEALRSPDLIEQVVVSLGLTTLYTTPEGLHQKALYGSSLPVNVSFPDMQPSEEAEADIEISPEGKILIRKLNINKEPFKVSDGTALAFGDAVNTPAGKMVIQKTPFFKEGEKYDIRLRKLPLATATEIFTAEITVDHSANKRSNVIDIVCIDTNKERADDILTTLIKCYVQNWLKGKAEVVAATNEFISQRLDAVEAELSGVDNSISSYKSNNLIPDVAASSSMFMQQSNEMNNQIMEYNNQLQMARYLKSYISAESKNQVLPVNTGLSNSNVETLINQYNALVLQRNSLLTSTSETNPIIVDIDSRLAALRSSILSSIDNTIVSLTNTVATMERREQTSTAKVAASPQQARYLLSAERKQKVQENLYLYLLQKREENELSQAFVNVNTRILRQPSGLKTPVSPKKAQTYIIAFAIGLLIPLGSIYLLELTNTTVRGRKDLEGMSVPIAGEIPRFKTQGRKWAKIFKPKRRRMERAGAKDDIVVQDGKRDIVNEAVRVLRSNITRMTTEIPHSVVMVTSINSGSGKTFVTMNLGVSLALKRHRVLLIDGDLRRASLSHYADSPRKGLADFLAGGVSDIESVIVRNVETEGLDMLPVGNIPPNPTELLETPRFGEMIRELKQQYDYIFIDCPPGEMMADAQIVADVADRTLFVMRIGLFPRVMLADVEKFYHEKKYPGMMIVLNDSIVGTYNYSYSYGYGYSRRHSKPAYGPVK